MEPKKDVKTSEFLNSTVKKDDKYYGEVYESLDKHQKDCVNAIVKSGNASQNMAVEMVLSASEDKKNFSSIGAGSKNVSLQFSKEDAKLELVVYDENNDRHVLADYAASDEKVVKKDFYASSPKLQEIVQSIRKPEKNDDTIKAAEQKTYKQNEEKKHTPVEPQKEIQNARTEETKKPVDRLAELETENEEEEDFFDRMGGYGYEERYENENKPDNRPFPANNHDKEKTETAKKENFESQAENKKEQADEIPKSDEGYINFRAKAEIETGTLDAIKNAVEKGDFGAGMRIADRVRERTGINFVLGNTTAYAIHHNALAGDDDRVYAFKNKDGETVVLSRETRAEYNALKAETKEQNKKNKSDKSDSQSNKSDFKIETITYGDKRQQLFGRYNSGREHNTGFHGGYKDLSENRQAVDRYLSSLNFVNPQNMSLFEIDTILRRGGYRASNGNFVKLDNDARFALLEKRKQMTSKRRYGMQLSQGSPLRLMRLANSEAESGNDADTTIRQAEQETRVIAAGAKLTQETAKITIDTGIDVAMMPQGIDLRVQRTRLKHEYEAKIRNATGDETKTALRKEYLKKDSELADKLNGFRLKKQEMKSKVNNTVEHPLKSLTNRFRKNDKLDEKKKFFLKNQRRKESFFSKAVRPLSKVIDKLNAAKVMMMKVTVAFAIGALVISILGCLIMGPVVAISSVFPFSGDKISDPDIHEEDLAIQGPNVQRLQERMETIIPDIIKEYNQGNPYGNSKDGSDKYHAIAKSAMLAFHKGQDLDSPVVNETSFFKAIVAAATIATGNEVRDTDFFRIYMEDVGLSILEHPNYYVNTQSDADNDIAPESAERVSVYREIEHRYKKEALKDESGNEIKDENDQPIEAYVGSDGNPLVDEAGMPIEPEIRDYKDTSRDDADVGGTFSVEVAEAGTEDMPDAGNLQGYVDGSGNPIAEESGYPKIMYYARIKIHFMNCSPNPPAYNTKKPDSEYYHGGIADGMSASVRHLDYEIDGKTNKEGSLIMSGPRYDDSNNTDELKQIKIGNNLCDIYYIPADRINEDFAYINDFDTGNYSKGVISNSGDKSVAELVNTAPEDGSLSEMSEWFTKVSDWAKDAGNTDIYNMAQNAINHITDSGSRSTNEEQILRYLRIAKGMGTVADGYMHKYGVVDYKHDGESSQNATYGAETNGAYKLDVQYGVTDRSSGDYIPWEDWNLVPVPPNSESTGVIDRTSAYGDYEMDNNSWIKELFSDFLLSEVYLDDEGNYKDIEALTGDYTSGMDCSVGTQNDYSIKIYSCYGKPMSKEAAEKLFDELKENNIGWEDTFNGVTREEFVSYLIAEGAKGQVSYMTDGGRGGYHPNADGTRDETGMHTDCSGFVSMAEYTKLGRGGLTSTLGLATSGSYGKHFADEGNLKPGCIIVGNDNGSVSMGVMNHTVYYLGKMANGHVMLLDCGDNGITIHEYKSVAQYRYIQRICGPWNIFIDPMK